MALNSVSYDVQEMANEPREGQENERAEDRPVDLSDFTHGAQSVKATCGCLAVALFLAALVYFARHFLFR